MSRKEQLAAAIDIYIEFLNQKVVNEGGGMDSISPSMFSEWLRIEASKEIK